MKKYLLAAAALLFLAASASAGPSTIDPTIPATNSLLSSASMRGNFAAAYADINKLIGQNSGTSAPGSPVLGQLWLNTTATPYVLNEWDGGAWVARGTLNASTHAWDANGTINGNTFTTGTGTLTVAAGKTLTANNSITVAGTDGVVMTTPTTSFTAARTDAAQTINGSQAFSGQVSLSGASGSESLRTTVVASAVNRVQVTGAVTGSASQVNFFGSDTDVNGLFGTKGAGSFQFSTNTLSSSAIQFYIAHAASAVNYHTFYGAATGNNPTWEARGSDANINLYATSKGAGGFGVYTNGGGTTSRQFFVAHTANAVNYPQATGGVSGGYVRLEAKGADANIPLLLSSQGTGNVEVWTNGGNNLAASFKNTASAVNAVRFAPGATGNPVVLDTTGSDTDRSIAITPAGAGTVNITGALGIGATPAAGDNVTVSKAITGSVNARGMVNNSIVQLDVSTSASYFSINPGLAPSASLTEVNGLDYSQGTFGAGSSLTNQYAFRCRPTVIGATNNYCFRGQVAAGTGRYNIYMDGTAQNFIAGDMQLGKTITAAGTTGAQTINKTALAVNFAAAASSLVVTNSLVATTSVITCTPGTVDSTMKSVVVVATAGSFTITANAAATAETRVNCLVFN